MERRRFIFHSNFKGLEFCFWMEYFVDVIINILDGVMANKIHFKNYIILLDVC